MKKSELKETINRISRTESYEQLRRINNAIFDRAVDLAYKQGKCASEESERFASEVMKSLNNGLRCLVETLTVKNESMGVK